MGHKCIVSKVLTVYWKYRKIEAKNLSSDNYTIIEPILYKTRNINQSVSGIDKINL